MSVAAENVIGGILLGGHEAYWRIADLLRMDDFHGPKLAGLYRICGEIARTKCAWDLMLVADQAERERVCSAADVISIASQTGSAASIRHHAERVKEDALNRRVRQICSEGAKTGDLREVQDRLAQVVKQLPAGGCRLVEALDETWQDTMQRYECSDEITGVATGIPLLDEMTGGLQPARVYGIGARAKMGKTVLAMNICAHASLAGRHVAVFSLEMGRQELTQRLLASDSGVPAVVMQRPKLLDTVESAMSRLTESTRRLRAASMWISDALDVTIEQIEAQARQRCAAGQLDLLCIDHLGLVRLPKADRHDIALGHVTRRAKAIAKELNIPVILVFQLNRESERGGPATKPRPPRPSDARDSGAIEQDLDAMLLLHRPNYYEKSAPSGLRLDVALQRNGPTGLIHMDEELDRCRFTGGTRPWVDAQDSGSRDNDL